MRITLERIITGPLADELHAIHKLLFDPIDEQAVEQQSLPDELFFEYLAHPDVLEFVGWTAEGLPHALMIVTTRLDLIPWINPASFHRLYPEHVDEDRVFYVPCLQIHPDSQGGPFVRAMVQTLARYIADHRGVVAFDSCQWDIDNTGLPKFIARWAEEVVETDAREIDAQRYFAYSFPARKEVDIREEVVIDLRESQAQPGVETTRDVEATQR